MDPQVPTVVLVADYSVDAPPGAPPPRGPPRGSHAGGTRRVSVAVDGGRVVAEGAMAKAGVVECVSGQHKAAERLKHFREALSVSLSS